jgi:hypothetical protein
MELREAHALIRQPVHVGRARCAMAVAAQLAVEIVADDPEDIWPL